MRKYAAYSRSRHAIHGTTAVTRAIIVIAVLLTGCAGEQPFRYGNEPTGYVIERQYTTDTNGRRILIEKRRPFAMPPRSDDHGTYSR